MKKLQLLFLLMLLPMVAMADAIEIDGIYYNLITKGQVAEVTSNPNNYTGVVVIPEEVTYEGVDYDVISIGVSAFEVCSGLTSVTIPNSVTSIGASVFSGCIGLTSVTIPNSVTSIGVYAFSDCTGLTSVTIPNSVTVIGEGAFKNCSGITSINIPNNVTSIGNNTFYGCSGLTSVTIPNSVTSIGNNTFYGCSGLTSVTIPNSVISIGRHAFGYCRSLTSVTIPNSVTSIGSCAFFSCRSLTSVTIPNSVTSIDGDVFAYCTALASIIIPNSVISIDGFAFRECSSLTSITIPNSVTSIGLGAFLSCSGLTSVTIGSGVKNINDQAFAKCPNLTNFYCYTEKVPSTNTNAFAESLIEYATLHVPEASISLYQTAEPWKNFGKIVTLSGDTPEKQKCATPTIFYCNKKLMFSCDTEGVEYVSEVKVADGKKYYDSSVTLDATYEISVYATKTGYENSEVATATLVWTSATFTETTKPSGVREISYDIPALISTQGSTITVTSEAEGIPISVYGINGTQEGAATISNGSATINTTLQPGSVAIVKIGQKSVKVVMK